MPFSRPKIKQYEKKLLALTMLLCLVNQSLSNFKLAAIANVCPSLGGTLSNMKQLLNSDKFFFAAFLSADTDHTFWIRWTTPNICTVLSSTTPRVSSIAQVDTTPYILQTTALTSDKIELVNVSKDLETVEHQFQTQFPVVKHHAAITIYGTNLAIISDGPKNHIYKVDSFGKTNSLIVGTNVSTGRNFILAGRYQLGTDFMLTLNLHCARGQYRVTVLQNIAFFKQPGRARCDTYQDGLDIRPGLGVQSYYSIGVQSFLDDGTLASVRIYPANNGIYSNNSILYVTYNTIFILKTQTNVYLFDDASTTPVITQADANGAKTIAIYTPSQNPPNFIQFMVASPPTAIPSMPVQQWVLTGQSSTKACGTDCRVCTGNNANQCKTCVPGKWIDFAGNEFGTCSNTCHPACTQCRGPSYTDCVPQQCSEGYSQPTVGSTTCLFTSCDEACTSCQNVGFTMCIPGACSTGFTQEGTSSTCKRDCLPTQNYMASNNTCCDESCLTCTGTGRNQCTSCAVGFTSPSANSTYCNRICPGRQYHIFASNTCQPCDPACLECTGPSYTECVAGKCSNGYRQFLSTTHCIPQCPNGPNGFDQITGQCCNQTCSTCQGLTDKDCLACLDSNQFVDKLEGDKGKCSDCHESCLTCSGPGSFKCTSCIPVLVLRNGQCTPCTGFFEQINGKKVCVNCNMEEFKNHSKCKATTQMEIICLKVTDPRIILRDIIQNQNQDKAQRVTFKLISDVYHDYSKALNVLFKDNIPLFDRFITLTVVKAPLKTSNALLSQRLYQQTPQNQGNDALPQNRTVSFQDYQIEYTIDYETGSLEEGTLLTVVPKVDTQVLLENYLPGSNTLNPNLMVEFNSQRVPTMKYSKQVSQSEIKSVEVNGELASISSASIAGGAGASVMILGGIGLDFIHPLLALFQILKLVSRMKLVNIFWGAILETFFSKINGLFELPNIDSQAFEEVNFKYRFKMDQYDVTLFALAAVWEKYIFYFCVLLLRQIVKRVNRYALDKERVGKWDAVLIQATVVLMAICLTFVALDNLLFGVRSILHSNIKHLEHSNWVAFNFGVALLFLTLFTADLIQLFLFNRKFQQKMLLVSKSNSQEKQEEQIRENDQEKVDDEEDVNDGQKQEENDQDKDEEGLKQEDEQKGDDQAEDLQISEEKVQVEDLQIKEEKESNEIKDDLKSSHQDDDEIEQQEQEQESPEQKNPGKSSKMDTPKTKEEEDIEIQKKLLLTVKPDSQDYSTFYNKYYVSQVSYDKGFITSIVAYYQSIYLARLVIFEVLYVSLQTLPLAQITIVAIVQLMMTLFTIYCVLFKRIFLNMMFGIFKLVTDLTLMIFLGTGLVFEIKYGGATAEEKFSSANTEWISAQYFCLYMVFLCCFTMLLNLIIMIIVVVRKVLKDRKLQKLIHADQKKIDDEEEQIVLKKFKQLEQEEKTKVKDDHLKQEEQEEQGHKENELERSNIDDSISSPTKLLRNHRDDQNARNAQDWSFTPEEEVGNLRKSGNSKRNKKPSLTNL